MILRVLIFLFAFNAIIPTAFAAGEMSNCKMQMDEMSSMVMTSDTNSCSMSDMDEVCVALDCVNSCMINIMPMIDEINETVFQVTPFGQPSFNKIHYYNLIHPVKTPPPLV